MGQHSPIETLQRFERAGIKREHAEALADELHHATVSIVTKEDLSAAISGLRSDLTATVWTSVGVATGIVLAAISFAATILAK